MTVIGAAERAARTEAVLARFRDKPFDWRTSATCIHLARAQLAAMGWGVPVVPAFRSPLGAKRAMKARGADGLAMLIDAQGPVRIAPAEMVVGDLAMLPGEPPFDALTIYAGAGHVLGWHGEDLTRMHAIAVSGAEMLAAWRL